MTEAAHSGISPLASVLHIFTSHTYLGVKKLNFDSAGLITHTNVEGGSGAYGMRGEAREISRAASIVEALDGRKHGSGDIF